MQYYVHNFIDEENGDLRSYHKSFYFEGKRKRLVKKGRSKTTYFENYSFKSDEEKILAYLHSIDKSLNFIYQDCFSKENQVNKLGKKKVVLKSKDTINFYLSNREVVELMKNWNNKKYRHESVLVNREFFQVIQSIRKILKVKKLKFKFEYISSEENEAKKLVEQYSYQYEKKEKLSNKSLEINKNAGKFYDKNFKTSISLEDRDKLWNKLF